jgi:hypothetical protein
MVIVPPRGWVPATQDPLAIAVRQLPGDVDHIDEVDAKFLLSNPRRSGEPGRCEVNDLDVSPGKAESGFGAGSR